MNQKDSNGANLLELRVSYVVLEMVLNSEFLEYKIIGLQCKVLSGPELKNGWFAQILQRTSLVFFIKVSYIPMLTSTNFYGIF